MAREMKNNIVYILVMIITSYLIRVIPFFLIKKPIKNVFVRSFLYYVPYITLALMTFPSIMDGTSSPYIGIVSFVFGIISAWCGLGLFPTALICSATVLILELI